MSYEEKLRRAERDLRRLILAWSLAAFSSGVFAGALMTMYLTCQ